MPTVSIRDLGRNPSRVVEAVTSTGRPALVTKNGRPVVAMVPIDESALTDWVLASAGDPPVGTSLEESREAVLRDARPIAEYGGRRIAGVSDDDADALLAAVGGA